MNYIRPVIVLKRSTYLDQESENVIKINIESKYSKPKYIFIFNTRLIDFLPPTYSLGQRSPVAEQIIKTIIAGKSRNTILLSAQQFKSAVDPVYMRIQEYI